MAPSVPAGYCRAEGMIKNVNTIEEYRSLDKGAVLSKAARTVSKFQNIKMRCALLIDRKDLGRHQRRHNILMSVTLGLVRCHLLCRSQEIQVHLSVRIPSSTL